MRETTGEQISQAQWCMTWNVGVRNLRGYDERSQTTGTFTARTKAHHNDEAVTSCSLKRYHPLLQKCTSNRAMPVAGVLNSCFVISQLWLLLERAEWRGDYFAGAAGRFGRTHQNLANFHHMIGKTEYPPRLPSDEDDSKSQMVGRG